LLQIEIEWIELTRFLILPIMSVRHDTFLNLNVLYQHPSEQAPVVANGARGWVRGFHMTTWPRQEKLSLQTLQQDPWTFLHYSLVHTRGRCIYFQPLTFYVGITFTQKDQCYSIIQRNNWYRKQNDIANLLKKYMCIKTTKFHTWIPYIQYKPGNYNKPFTGVRRERNPLIEMSVDSMSAAEMASYANMVHLFWPGAM
jgi:hypothetical protein